MLCLTSSAIIIAFIWLASGGQLAWVTLASGLVIFLGASVLAIVLHELGHLLVARAFGFRVTAMHLGSPPALVTVKLGSIKLCLGVRMRGRVSYAGPAPSARLVAVTAAGPLANVLVAAALTPWAGRVWQLSEVAVVFAVAGLVNLVPFHRSGQTSDGLTLLRSLRVALIPAGRRAEADVHRLLDEPGWEDQADAADRLLAGYRHGVPAARMRCTYLVVVLRRAGRIEEMLRVHAARIAWPRTPTPRWLHAVHHTEWELLTIPGIPKRAARLAARRVRRVLRHHPEPRAAIEHTLALALLRQGRPGKVERLCAPGLGSDLRPGERATVLATVALARHALGQEAGPPLRDALALDPTADLVGEAASKIGGSGPPEYGQAPGSREAPAGGAAP